MKATLSIMGLYNYDPTIFENLHIPSGMNKATLIAMIITRCAELELLYSDPDFLKNYIGVWSSVELPAWEKMYASTQLEYNPIENYDRMESITDTTTTTGNGNTTIITDDTTIFAGKNDSLTTVENKVAGFNSSTLVNNNDNTTDVGATSSGSNDYNGDQRTTSSNSSNMTNTHTARIHGNIGVTTAPQMIKEYREIESFNAYDYIVNRFKLEFCVMVY